MAGKTRTPGLRRGIGYQPGLDGLRALSVIAVICYHAGFSWAHGGFLGVEVFFVVSGFLITSLLLDEHDRFGAVALAAFWLRRARRLLPALVAMVVVVAGWAAVRGNAAERADLHRDLLPGLFYIANWAQIVGGALYFGNFSPLRHLWSLAVEEQWYLVWPLTFVALSRWKVTNRVRAGVVVGSALTVMIVTWNVASRAALTSSLTNFLYLSTLTRSSGLLLGAGMAFIWRPWRSAASAAPGAGRLLDSIGIFAVVVLAVEFAASTSVVDRGLYQGRLAITSIASVVAVLAVTHPDAAILRSLLGWRPLVAVGRRSYGLYLWSWPISVFYGAYNGRWTAFLKAMATTIVVSELCYRFIEIPVRSGRLLETVRSLAPQGRRVVRFGVWGTAAVLVMVLGLFYAGVKPYDRAAGGAEVAFDPSAGSVTDQAANATTDNSTPGDTSNGDPTLNAATETTTALPRRRVVVVGDSQAHALSVNLPRGLGKVLAMSDGSVDGCGIHDAGTAISARPGFTKPLAECAGFATKWARSAARAKATTALVVLGAWDVLDVQTNGQTVAVGTPAGDQLFLADLAKGIDALRSRGVHVALLEIACMRPVAAVGAAVPVLPERADDTRVAHLNKLLRQAADTDPAHVTFVRGPTAWCSDPTISTSTAYRWDGVHVYKPGAALIMETITAQLVELTQPT